MRGFANRQGPIGTATPPTNPTQGPVSGIAGPTQAPSTPIPEVAKRSQAATFAQQQAQDIDKKNDEKKSKFINALVKAGVPLGAAIWGSVDPNALPAAAGLAQGWNKGVSDQEDYQLKADEAQRKSAKDMGDDEVAIIDPETGEQQIIKVKPGARIMKKGGQHVTTEDLMDRLNNMDKGGSEKDAATKSLEGTRSKYSAADIRHTAEQHGISEEDVLKQLSAGEEE